MFTSPNHKIVAKVEYCCDARHEWLGSNGEEFEANARLIAAAPELLAALKMAYQQCIQFLNEGDFRRNVEWDAGYIVDAIARAEGK